MIEVTIFLAVVLALGTMAVNIYEWRRDLLNGSYLKPDDHFRYPLIMLDNQKFKFVCDACGSYRQILVTAVAGQAAAVVG
jgi:hypothetical protein